jgi:cell division protein FtsB
MRDRFLASVYTSLLLYLVSMFFFGAAGHFAYRNLKKQFEVLEKNTRSLTVQGRKLGYAVTALRSDPQSIVKAGRRLLLLREREGIIRVEGYREKPRPVSPGGLVVLKKDAGLRLEPFLRAFALAGGLLVFLFYRPRRDTRNL